MMDCCNNRSKCDPAMDVSNRAQHTTLLPNTENDEPYDLLLRNDCDRSVMSSMTCSVASRCLKRTFKAVDLTSFKDPVLQDTRNKRRRGAGYNKIEVHSLLHLMSRVLPKCADEWEIIRLVHNKIFPDNARTASSLKRKFRDLCREADGSFGVQRDVIRAKEIELLISQKPSGYQMVLPTNGNHDFEVTNICQSSIPLFKVKVPNPLQEQGPNTTDKRVPEYIQIPESPNCDNVDTQRDEDEMSELDLDEYVAVKDNAHPIIFPPVNPIIKHDGIVTPSLQSIVPSKPPVVIVDYKL